MRNRTIGVWLGLVGAALGLGYVLGRSRAPVDAASEVTASSPATEISERPDGAVEAARLRARSRGPEDAAVTIEEFTDFECPFCRRYFLQVYPELMAQYGGRVHYVIRYFPLESIHPHAFGAAEAAACASRQGKFWAYHDILFRHAAALETRSLKMYARDLGLDAPSFDKCLDSESPEAEIIADLRDGVGRGIRGTPTFFINGQALVGAQPLEVFQAFIEDGFQRAGTP